MKTTACLLSCLFCAVAFCGEPDAEALYKDGIAKLKESQVDHAALVPAMRLLAKAAEAFEKAGDEIKGAEVNSCLYWAKKRMVLADTQGVGTNGTAKRLEAAAKPVAASEAKAMLEKADLFAKNPVADPLLVAIRYFEVADRFPETMEGRKAMGWSLAAMQKVGAEKMVPYKATLADGKVFVQSEPPGAQVVLVTEEGKKDTGKRTPALVELPKGVQRVEFSLKGYQTGRITVQVGDIIEKPEKIVLTMPTVAVDIVFEQGWTVFVDGKIAKAVDKPETPCTVEVPLGVHEVGLAKEGFVDLAQRVTVSENGVKGGNKVEFAYKPANGASALFARLSIREKDRICGRYVTQEGGTIMFTANGKFVGWFGAGNGKWDYKNGKLLVMWDKWPMDTMAVEENGDLTNNNRQARHVHYKRLKD